MTVVNSDLKSVRTALNAYDSPTKAELDSAQASIESDIAGLTDVTAGEVVTAMQAVADDFKADVSGLALTTDLGKLATKGDLAALD